MQPKFTPTTNQTTPTQNAGVSRRGLVRAGASAVPVLAALKANTVLAGGDHTCIRPSSFASLAAAQWKLSQGRTVKTDYTCYSHGYWKNKTNGLPQNFKAKQFLDPAEGFVRNPSGFYTAKTFQQVLGLQGNAHDTALARHVVAMYLSAVSVNDDPLRVTLTKAQCREIWNTRGVWSPFPGANWDYNTTFNYLEKLLGAPFL